MTVVPVASETALRLRSWMENNRRTVDRLSGGRVAYVYLPDTAGGGFANFNRYYFSQVGHQAAVIDERFNHGGEIADYIIDQLRHTEQVRQGHDPQLERAVAEATAQLKQHPVQDFPRAQTPDKHPLMPPPP